MAQAIEALSNLIREELPRKINMAEHGTRKHKLIRALLGMKHSPAGKKYLAKKKTKPGTQAVYFKHIRRKTDAQRLLDAGLTKDELRSLGIK